MTYKPTDEVINYDPTVRETQAIPVKRTDSQLLRSINDHYSFEHSKGGRVSSEHGASERKIALMKKGVLEFDLTEVSYIIDDNDDDLLSRLVIPVKKPEETKWHHNH